MKLANKANMMIADVKNSFLMVISIVLVKLPPVDKNADVVWDGYVLLSEFYWIGN